jgi:Tol biopolymer transport system component/uncharacterized protein YjdB
MKTLPRLVLLAALGVAPAARAQTVTELYVTPDTLTLDVGQKQGLTVQAFDANGNAILRINYRSTDDGIVVVEGAGTVTGVAAGEAQIVVTAGRKTALVYVQVGGDSRSSAGASAAAAAAAANFTSMTVDPAAVFLLPGERGRVRAVGVRADGSGTAQVRATWTAMQPQIATVEDTSGMITAVAVGQGMMQALAPNGLTATVPVFVSQDEYFLQQNQLGLTLNDSLLLSTVVPKQRTRHLQNGDLQWASANLAVAQVSTQGVVKAVGLGKTEVVVRGFGQERRLTVSVHPEIARFLTSPRLADTVRMPMLAVREFKVQAVTADSTGINDLAYDWVVGDTTVAVFDPGTGVLTAKHLGTTTLSFATRGFVPKSWTVQVVAAALGVNRTKLSLGPNERTKLVASYLDEQGKAAGAAAGVVWTTSNPGVVRANLDGTLEAVAPGRATISAAIGDGTPVTVQVMVTGDLLVVSSRLGKLGIYALAGTAGEVFIPVVADTFSNNIDPSYSPDRTRIAFSSDKFGSGNYDIYVADADGRNPVRLTTDPGLDVQPVWTPDGQSIVFSSSRTGIKQLMVMKADGTDAREIARLPGGAEDPAISPDGKMIAFTGYPGPRDGQTDIYTVALWGGSPVVAVSTKDRREHSPAYLPSGELIYVADRREKKEQNQVLRHSGTGMETSLVASDAPIVGIAVSRLGDRLAWTTSQAIDKTHTQTTLRWRDLSSGIEVSVQLLPGERVASPTF